MPLDCSRACSRSVCFRCSTCCGVSNGRRRPWPPAVHRRPVGSQSLTCFSVQFARHAGRRGHKCPAHAVDPLCSGHQSAAVQRWLRLCLRVPAISDLVVDRPGAHRLWWVSNAPLFHFTCHDAASSIVCPFRFGTRRPTLVRTASRPLYLGRSDCTRRLSAPHRRSTRRTSARPHSSAAA